MSDTKDAIGQQPARTEIAGRVRVRVRSELREPQHAFERRMLLEDKCEPEYRLTLFRPRVTDRSVMFQFAQLKR